ncbi:unnamed protein product [Eruca vesicaria subsp. sativa]|uniref:Uncharacterized protein n=1 Tax=Eruca vesicaria subsp. sativa TaxID=29727 RepID=A0ABC8M000_ERUVS|nr:unnamed protein product [Eruca vesicaria subsp. sativa]
MALELTLVGNTSFNNVVCNIFHDHLRERETNGTEAWDLIRRPLPLSSLFPLIGSKLRIRYHTLLCLVTGDEIESDQGVTEMRKWRRGERPKLPASSFHLHPPELLHHQVSHSDQQLSSPWAQILRQTQMLEYTGGCRSLSEFTGMSLVWLDLVAAENWKILGDRFADLLTSKMLH